MPFNSEEVKLFIRENIKTIRGERDVARHVGKSVETVRKDFSRNGESLSRCILETRIEKMKHLLATRELPCKEICFEAGFRREDSGAKRFREDVKMSMTAYRALYKIKSPQKNRLKRRIAHAY